MDYLSIDIGGTMIKTAIIDRSGQIFEKEEFPTPKDSLEELKCLLVRKIEKVQYQIKGIAICVPGKVNNRIGKILVGGSLHYLDGFEMSDFIKTNFDIPVSVENDAKAAALAELWRGTLKNKSNGILLVLGTAVGGAILYDGKIMRGSTFQAGELSYQLTEKNHVLNYQGRNLSAVRMIEEIGNILDLENPDDGVAVFKYLNNHDSRVLPVFKNYCKRLAILINNLQVTLDINYFILSGGISQQEILFDTVRKCLVEIRQEFDLLEKAFETPKVLPAKMSSDANLYGALYQLFINLEEEQFYDYE